VAVTDPGHPTWCSPRRCRVPIGGTHHGEPVEVRHRDIRVTAWLQQRPGDEAMLGWATTYRLMSGPVAFLPLSQAVHLVAGLVELVDQEHDATGQER
jgi:hypothetical protein